MAFKVIIMRGVSGSGKSTWIRKNHPNAIVCSADHFFIDDAGVYRFDPNKLSEAHSRCLKKFVKMIVNGCSETIVVDNTNTQLWEMSPYVQVASAYGYKVEIVRINCDVKTAASRNTHGVPEKSVESMAKRFQKVLPWWKETVVDNNP